MPYNVVVNVMKGKIMTQGILFGREFTKDEVSIIKLKMETAEWFGFRHTEWVLRSSLEKISEGLPLSKDEEFEVNRALKFVSK